MAKLTAALLTALATAVSAHYCKPDGCLHALTAHPPSASAFCSAHMRPRYARPTGAVPAYASDACSGYNAKHLSSACLCMQGSAKMTGATGTGTGSMPVMTQTVVPVPIGGGAGGEPVIRPDVPTPIVTVITQVINPCGATDFAGSSYGVSGGSGSTGQGQAGGYQAGKGEYHGSSGSESSGGTGEYHGSSGSEASGGQGEHHGSSGSESSGGKSGYGAQGEYGNQPGHGGYHKGSGGKYGGSGAGYNPGAHSPPSHQTVPHYYNGTAKATGTARGPGRYPHGRGRHGPGRYGPQPYPTGVYHGGPTASSGGYHVPLNTGYNIPLNTSYGMPLGTGYNVPLATGYTSSSSSPSATSTPTFATRPFRAYPRAEPGDAGLEVSLRSGGTCRIEPGSAYQGEHSLPGSPVTAESYGACMQKCDEAGTCAFSTFHATKKDLNCEMFGAQPNPRIHSANPDCDSAVMMAFPGA